MIGRGRGLSNPPLGAPFFELFAADFEMHAVFAVEASAPYPAFFLEEVLHDGEADLGFAVGEPVKLAINIDVERKAKGVVGDR